MQEYFEVGQIVNTFGVKGMVKVNPFTDEMQRFEELKEVYVCKKEGMQTMKIEQVKYHKNMVLLKFAGIEDLNEAEKLKGYYLKIDRKHAKKLPKDTYFIADLIGLSVYTDEGKLLGRVEDIYETGANYIYEIKNVQGKQILLPNIPDVIQEIDLENEKITVHLLKGLVDEK